MITEKTMTIFRLKSKIKTLQIQQSKLVWEGEFGRAKMIQKYQYILREKLAKLRYRPKTSIRR